MNMYLHILFNQNILGFFGDETSSEGMPCRLSGSWVSEKAGVRLILSVNGSGPIKYVKWNKNIF